MSGKANVAETGIGGKVSSFTQPLSVTKIKVKKLKFWRFFSKNKFKLVDMWRVDKEFEYHVGSEDSNDIICIKEGAISDGASIPRFAWPIVGHPMAEYAQAAFVHDELYRTQIRDRIIADAIFYEAMGALKVVKWKRIVMHQAVRRLGWIPWNKRANQ